MNGSVEKSVLDFVYSTIKFHQILQNLQNGYLDTQHNDTRLNITVRKCKTQHNDIKHNNKKMRRTAL
jgi:hypothetical protein